MALIKCKECGKEISDKAKTCPNCGNPTKSKRFDIDKEVSTLKKFLIVGIVVIAFAIVAFWIVQTVNYKP